MAVFKITPPLACVPWSDTKFIASRLIIHFLELLPLSVSCCSSRISLHFGYFYVFHCHVVYDLLRQKEALVDLLCNHDIIVVPWKFSIMLI